MHSSVRRPWYQRISSVSCFKSSIFCYFVYVSFFLFYIFLPIHRCTALVFVFCFGNRLDRWWCFKIPISKLQRKRKTFIFFGKHSEREKYFYFWLIVVFLSRFHRIGLVVPMSCSSNVFSTSPLGLSHWWILICVVLPCLALRCVFDDSQNNILIVYLDF